jgi:hypothetical protein
MIEENNCDNLCNSKCEEVVCVKIVRGKGCTGPRGYQGVTGPNGDKGDTGPQGDKGDTGPQGDQGVTGPQGDQGVTGPQGDQGVTGPQGDQGVTGPQGDKGDTGSQGDQGYQGVNGSQGDQGDQGVNGPQGDQGFTGPQGEQGITGSQGDQGVQGFTGPQGEQGITGSQGDQGVTGLKGSAFEPAYIFVWSDQTYQVPLGSPLTFNNIGLFKGCLLIDPSTIEVRVDGIYCIMQSVDTLEPNSFAVYKNGVIELGTWFGANNTSQDIGASIISLKIGDTIQLINQSSQGGTVTLFPLGSGTNPSIGQSSCGFRIFKISDL